MQRHRRNSNGHEATKMENIPLRDGHAYRGKGAGSWMPVPRRSMRSLRRLATFVVLIFVFVLLWQELDPSDGSNTVARYTARAKRRAKELRKGKQSVKMAEVHGVWPGLSGISNMFAFGDSHSETGFDPDGAQPSDENPIGNPAWPGRTAAYGPNYLSHLTGTYNETRTSLFNMARGGLVGQSRELDSGAGDRIPVLNQLQDVFLPRYGRAGSGKFKTGSGWRGADSLFVLYDYTDELVEQFMLRKGDPRNISRVVEDMERYEANLDLMYEYGARNFLVINMPALEESFTLRNAPIKRTLTTFGAEAVDTNGRLAFLVQHFARAHSDATVFFYDLHRVSIRTRGDPGYYPETAGIRRKEGFCPFYSDRKDVVEDDDACGNPLREFYWRDERHHTEPFHRLMARQAVDLMKDLDRAMPLEVP